MGSLRFGQPPEEVVGLGNTCRVVLAGFQISANLGRECMKVKQSSSGDVCRIEDQKKKRVGGVQLGSLTCGADKM